jgi:hypothetical protein
MQDARKDALAIYEKICATSADRPFAFNSPEQMYREIAAWQANNSALNDLRQAPPDTPPEGKQHVIHQRIHRDNAFVLRMIRLTPKHRKLR